MKHRGNCGGVVIEGRRHTDMYFSEKGNDFVHIPAIICSSCGAEIQTHEQIALEENEKPPVIPFID